MLWLPAPRLPFAPLLPATNVGNRVSAGPPASGLSATCLSGPVVRVRTVQYNFASPSTPFPLPPSCTDLRKGLKISAAPGVVVVVDGETDMLEVAGIGLQLVRKQLGHFVGRIVEGPWVRGQCK